MAGAVMNSDSAGKELFNAANPGIVAGSGVAGTPAGGVQSVQGVSGGTVVPVTNLALGTVAPGTAGTQSQLAGAVFNSTAPAPTTGQQIAAQADADGSIYVSETRSDARAALTGTLAATGNLIATSTRGFRHIAVQVTGTYTATVTFEVSNDTTNGTDGNWVSIAGYQPGTPGTVTVTAAGSPGVFVFICDALWFRARISAYTSGTAVGTAYLRLT